MTALLLVAMATSVSPEQQQELLKVFRDEFVAITPGEGKFPASFFMGDSVDGSASPRHEVRMTKPFWIAKYEVPQNLWEAVMGNNPSRWKGKRNSVEMLDWKEAVAFCQRSTKLMREAGLIEKDQEIRLPTEAEWEYVARAGTTTSYSFGADDKDLDKYGWHTGNAAGNDPPVGAKAANPWGLYDIHGYLWEWCLDGWHQNYEGAPADGSAWSASSDKQFGVLRGGSWKDKSAKLTSFYRQRADRKTRDDAVGLRCVLADVGK